MENIEKKYFKVVCKCGHVGKNSYFPVQFAVKAENGKEAAKKARMFPRVKHDHKDAILMVEKISFEQFIEIKNENKTNDYLYCKNIQEQREKCDLTNLLVEDIHNKKQNYIKEPRKDRIDYKLKKIKNELKNVKEKKYEYCY